MKVLTAAEMRDVDRRTEEIGITGEILMENAGHRVVEFLAERFAPISEQRILILCGKGNNGGDGYVVARQLFTRFRPRRLDVVAMHPEEMSSPRRMLEACGCAVASEITPEMTQRRWLSTQYWEPASTDRRGEKRSNIREINAEFPDAEVVAVDVPSGMNSDSGTTPGEMARANATVTFTAPKLCHVLPPNCDHIGELRVGHIGSPARLMDDVTMHLAEPTEFREVLGRRERDSNKGTTAMSLLPVAMPEKRVLRRWPAWLRCVRALVW